MFRFLLILIFQFSMVSIAHAEALESLLTSEQVQITGVQGRGASSGASLTGTLTNRTGSTIKVDAVMLEPIYFDNAGSAQNMVATQVYGSGGAYYLDGTRRYIELSPHESMQVLFIAYCADFERDNPGYSDALHTAPMPYRIASVARKIAEYEASNPDVDTVAPAQLALWLSQGVTPDQIREQFNFDQEDLENARSILR